MADLGESIGSGLNPHRGGLPSEGKHPHSGKGISNANAGAPVPRDQTKQIGTPNSNAQGPPTLGMTIKRNAEHYAGSTLAQMRGTPSPGSEGGPVTRVRVPEHDGQAIGEGDVGLASPSTAALMPGASEGPSVAFPSRADRQLSDAEIFSPADPVSQEGLIGSNTHTPAKDAYKTSLTKAAMPGTPVTPGQNMAKPKLPAENP